MYGMLFPKFVLATLAVLFSVPALLADSEDTLSPDQLASVRQIENLRIDVIDQVIGSVIAIYGEERQGGGSGVIIDPSGIALTNHHVIMGAGTKGWGGLADGQMYRWELIGTDPGGDVSIIQMKGKEKFPFTPLADSDTVRVGDWSLAMGNPFVLTEDQKPTVTLGIVSGVKRYQYGAGQNQLVYGNCIQTDSSINPGNSGGPLFNLKGRVIGINGRGSFKERGRVNVGLGYAISSNQIKNFIPDLLATKLVEHGTLDANFEDRDGKVVCSNLFEDSKLYDLGVRPGDELLKFEGETIYTANQFTNLICTLPEDWPATLLLKQRENGELLTVHTRLYGLPYQKPSPPKKPTNDKDQTPEQKEQAKRAAEMIELLSAAPGTIRHDSINRQYADQIVAKWQSGLAVIKPTQENEKVQVWRIKDRIVSDGKPIGIQEIELAANGQFRVVSKVSGERTEFVFRDGKLYQIGADSVKELSLVEMKLCAQAVQAIGMAAANQLFDLESLGNLKLDGSDKALQRKAYRMKFLDEDDDQFYFWLSMENPAGDEQIRLLKAGADIDCQHDFGGITFSQWNTESGLFVAKKRHQISGLAESQKWAIEATSVDRLEMELPLWSHSEAVRESGERE